VPLTKSSTHAFPFSIQIPAWLPSSQITSPVLFSYFALRYELRAIVVPRIVTGSGADKNPHFYGFTTVNVVNPMNEAPKLDLKTPWSATIGGFLGIASETASAEVIFEKNSYS